VKPIDLVIDSISGKAVPEVPVFELGVNPQPLFELLIGRGSFPKSRAINSMCDRLYSFVKGCGEYAVGFRNNITPVQRAFGKVAAKFASTEISGNTAGVISKTKIDALPVTLEPNTRIFVKNGKEYMLDEFCHLWRIGENGWIEGRPVFDNFDTQYEKVMKSLDSARYRLDGQINDFNNLRKKYEDKLALMVKFGGAYELAWGYFGNEFRGAPFFKMIRDTIRGKEHRLTNLLDRNEEYYSALVDKLGKTGSKMVVITEDWADDHGPLMKPEWFEKLFLPYLERITEKAHSHNMKVMFHTDGNIESIMPLLLESGVDALQPIENQLIDIHDFKDEYGKDVCLVSNVSDKLIKLRRDGHGYWRNLHDKVITPRIIDSIVRKELPHLAEGSKFIFTSGNCLWDTIPVGAVNCMHNSVKNYPIPQ